MPVTFSEELLTVIFMEILAGSSFTGLMWYLFIRKTPKVIITAKIGGIRRIIKEVKFNIKELSSVKKVSIAKKERKYHLNGKYAIENKKGKPTIYFDKDNVEPLNIGEDIPRNAEDFNNLTDNEFTRNFIKGENVRMYLIIIAILAIGLMISITLTMYIIQNPEQFIHAAVNGTKTVVTTTKGVSPVNP